MDCLSIIAFLHQNLEKVAEIGEEARQKGDAASYAKYVKYLESYFNMYNALNKEHDKLIRVLIRDVNNKLFELIE